MSSFTSRLIIELLPDGKRWQLNRPFTYRIGSRYSRHFVSVSKGFVTDWASIPKFIFWLLPWWAKFQKGAVLHDWLYKVKYIMGKPITRKQADDVFLEAMLIDFRNHKSGKVVAFTEHLAVRLFGWLSWH